MTNNITLTQGGTTVTLSTTSVSEDQVNPLIIISIPSTDLIKITKAVNLLKILRRWEVDGLLDDELTIPVASRVKALTKRNNLRAMFRAKLNIVFNYQGDNFNVGIEKLSIKHIPTDSDTADTTGDAKDIANAPQTYDIKMTLVEIDLINPG